METRVVITGMGIVSPIGNTLDDFKNSLQKGVSGIRFYPHLKELAFGCQVAGVPQGIDEKKKSYFRTDELLAMTSSMIYSGIAALDCWKDAKLPPPSSESVDWDTGAVIGTGVGAIDLFAQTVVPKTDSGKARRLGSSMIEQTMCSSVSAKIGGLLGLGGQVTTNSSACTTGTEAVYEAFLKIKNGNLKRVMAGGVEGDSHYIWAGFDGMRVLASKFNDTPEKASRPLSSTACGFVPSSGAGLLMLESLDSALERGAKIYAELIGGNVNCGGHRQGGSMTAPNPNGVIRCIQSAIKSANINPTEIDAINGHLTGTFADIHEIKNWTAALNTSYKKFPKINSTKSLLGHALGGAGGIECVATILQLSNGFLHPSINCEDLHNDIKNYENSIVQEQTVVDINIIAKTSFGFGDVNGCLIFKKFK